MEAAQAPIGEGPLRPAEGKEPKALQSEITRLMASCEKLRARKRFFANKVEEINDPPPPPPCPSSSTAEPFQLPLSKKQTGAGAAQPSTEEEFSRYLFPRSPPLDITSPPVSEAGDVPATSLDHLSQALIQMHTHIDSASLPSSDQMNLVESWVVSPPITRAPSPSAPPHHCDQPCQKLSSPPDQPAVMCQNVSMTDVTQDGPAGSADTQQADTSGLAMHQEADLRAVGKGDSVPDGSSNPDHDMAGDTSAHIAQQTSGQFSAFHIRQAKLETQAAPAGHVSRPGSAHSMHSVDSIKPQSQPVSRPGSTHTMQAAQHAQQLPGRPTSLSWGDGVRASVGVALAIGPWAHTSSSLPVTTQAPQPDTINLICAEQAETHHDSLTHHQHEQQNAPHIIIETPSEGGSQGDAAMDVNDQAEAWTKAADRAEASRAAAARETTPDDDSIGKSQMCNVCLCPIRQLIIVLQPCGHYYCENCTAAIRAAAYPRCPECRTRISSTFRVPLSSSQNQTLKEDAQHAQVGQFMHLALQRP